MLRCKYCFYEEYWIIMLLCENIKCTLRCLFQLLLTPAWEQWTVFKKNVLEVLSALKQENSNYNVHESSRETSSPLLHFLLSLFSASFFSFFYLETQIKSGLSWGEAVLPSTLRLQPILTMSCVAIRSIVFLFCLWFSSLVWNSNSVSLYFKLQQSKYVTRLQVKCLLLHEKNSCDVLIRCHHIFWEPTIWIMAYAVAIGIIRASEMAQWVKRIAANLNYVSGWYTKMKGENWLYTAVYHRYTVVWTHTQIIIIIKKKIHRNVTWHYVAHYGIIWDCWILEI